MKRTKKNDGLLVWSAVLPALLLAACNSGTRHAGDLSSNVPVYSHEISESVQEILPSLVEVVSILDYNIENFVYDVSSGAYVRDPKSPVGYKLDRSEGQNGVIRNKENIQSFGGGLVIGESSENYLVLTSRHIVVHNDTLNYFMRLGGRQTDVLRSRAVIRDARLAIREQERNALYNASLIAESYRTDLALISYSKFQTLNRVYDGAVAENIYPIWGKLGVIMGLSLIHI